MASKKPDGDEPPGLEVADLRTGSPGASAVPAGDTMIISGTGGGWFLEITRGIQAGQRHPLGETVQLGRSSDVDIPLQDGKASRYHARLDRHADIYRLTDLNSTNGTFVNAYRISRPVFLQAGDTIRIGDTQLQILNS